MAEAKSLPTLQITPNKAYKEDDTFGLHDLFRRDLYLLHTL